MGSTRHLFVPSSAGLAIAAREHASKTQIMAKSLTRQSFAFMVSCLLKTFWHLETLSLVGSTWFVTFTPDVTDSSKLTIIRFLRSVTRNERPAPGGVAVKIVVGLDFSQQPY